MASFSNINFCLSLPTQSSTTVIHPGIPTLYCKGLQLQASRVTSNNRQLYSQGPGATLFLTLVFVPKVHIFNFDTKLSLLIQMVNLCRDSKGQTVFSDQDKKTTLKSADPAAGTFVNGHNHLQNGELAVLRIRIAELENKHGMQKTST